MTDNEKGYCCDGAESNPCKMTRSYRHLPHIGSVDVGVTDLNRVEAGDGGRVGHSAGEAAARPEIKPKEIAGDVAIIHWREVGEGRLGAVRAIWAAGHQQGARVTAGCPEARETRPRCLTISTLLGGLGGGSVGGQLVVNFLHA